MLVVKIAKHGHIVSPNIKLLRTRKFQFRCEIYQYLDQNSRAKIRKRKCIIYLLKLIT